MKSHSQAICCSVTRDYLPGLIVLYNSILEYQDIPLYVLIADIDPGETAEIATQLSVFFPESARGKVHVVAPFDIYGQAIHQMRHYYDAFELSTACKGGILSWMQGNTTIDRWLYLDSDMLCFGTLEPFFTALDTFCILLTPHRSKPCATALNDIQYLSAGTFNGGVIGVRRSPESQAFTEWLCTVLTHYCLNDPALPPQDRFIQSTLLFVDQVWMDLAPAYFPKVVVLAGRGFNLGHWNADEGQLARRDGALYMGEDRVTLLHLSGWLEDQPGRFSKFSLLDWSGNTVWIGLHKHYQESLASLKKHFAVKYRFNSYPDGTEIPRKHRRAYLLHLLNGNPPVDEITCEKIAAIAARNGEQRKTDSEFYREMSHRDSLISDLSEKPEDTGLAAAIQQYRQAHTTILGWFLRQFTNYYSNSARQKVEELLTCDDQTFIRKIYISLLGRLPDPEGMAFYLKRLHEGLARTEILDSICTSPEYVSKTKNMRSTVLQGHRHDTDLNSGADMKPDSHSTFQRTYRVRDFMHLYDIEFLQAAYAAILGRKPDPAGEEYYLGRIRGGTSRENIMRQLTQSAEAKRHKIVIKGLWWALFVEKLANLPFFGALFSLMLVVFSAKELRTLRNKIYGLEYELSHYRTTISRQQQLLYVLKQRIETNDLDRENLVHSVPVALRKITRDIDEIRSQLEDTSHA